MARPLGATADACWRHHGGATVHARETSFVQNDFDDNNEEDEYDNNNKEAGSLGFILRNTSEGIFQVYVFR